MKKIAIIGSGDLGQLIAHHAVQDGDFEVVGFFDDVTNKSTTKEGVQIYGKSDLVLSHFEKGLFDYIIIGVGYLHFTERANLFNNLKGKVPFANVIHSSAIIDSSVSLGEGIFILPGCCLDKGVVINDNVLLNTGVTIAHDSKVEAHTFIAPRASVAGKTTIGSCCFIGINSTIIDNVVVQNNIQIAAGAVVVNNLDETGTYLGCPAKLRANS
ncbi:MAG: sugar O-acyltransferase (sialic acid O-acetyltransferase NeuD family) [Glaciecola sp.]|jgi:sugar O-acyltransferase (sialic acid O-acetyltransferase NeuD family)